MGYGEWLHGEAVATGMCMAARLSKRIGWLTSEALNRTEALIEKANLPTNPPENIDSSQFLALMSVDKKVKDGQIRLVLLKGIGESVVTSDFDQQALKDMLDEYHR